ncbi:MAG: ParB/RepB/Spo0J family partition protein [Bacteroidales bacterium]|nr:ParB/RepB/Spo0J family partition protein [Candidatus Egerieousia equi]
MPKIPTGLGRGLDALIPKNLQAQKQPNAAPAAQATPTSVCLIDIDLIDVNPFQPRTEFNEQALEELASSIALMGLIQPVTLRPIAGGKYQIISGERRWRASRMAGLKEIPAYIRKTDDNGMLEMAIVENIQRENLDAIEIAISFQRLIDECKLTQEEMAVRVGKKRASVANYLRLLKLPAPIQLALRQDKLSMGHAKCILGLEKEKDQLKMANAIIEKGLSVRAVEAMIRKITERQLKSASKDNSQTGAAESTDLPEYYFKVVDTLGRFFNNNVTVNRSRNGKGSFTISFASDSQVSQFLSALEEAGL